MLSEKIKELSDSLLYPYSKVTIQILDDILPKIEQLENEHSEMLEALISICMEFDGFLENDYNGCICDQDPEIIELIEKATGKKWEEIIK